MLSTKTVLRRGFPFALTVLALLGLLLVLSTKALAGVNTWTFPFPHEKNAQLNGLALYEPSPATHQTPSLITAANTELSVLSLQAYNQPPTPILGDIAPSTTQIATLGSAIFVSYGYSIFETTITGHSVSSLVTLNGEIVSALGVSTSGHKLFYGASSPNKDVVFLGSAPSPGATFAPARFAGGGSTPIGAKFISANSAELPGPIISITQLPDGRVFIATRFQLFEVVNHQIREVANLLNAGSADFTGGAADASATRSIAAVSGAPNGDLVVALNLNEFQQSVPSAIEVFEGPGALQLHLLATVPTNQSQVALAVANDGTIFLSTGSRISVISDTQLLPHLTSLQKIARSFLEPALSGSTPSKLDLALKAADWTELHRLLSHVDVVGVSPAEKPAFFKALQEQYGPTELLLFRDRLGRPDSTFPRLP